MSRVRGRTPWLPLAVIAALLGALVPVAAPAGAQQAERDPVIFVHGWSSTSIVWSAMVADFVAHGYQQDEIFLFDYDTYFTSNSRTAERFGQFVDDVLGQTGADKVDVVSHSMGSLSTRQCIKSGDCEGKVNDWVSLGGANHGTWVATLCLGFSFVTCSEMLPGSAYLRALNQPPEVTPGADTWTTLWSPGDGVIIPAESTILEGANNIQLSAAINHLSMLADPTVMAQVRDAVAN